jgi:hypothetical protein
MILDDSELCFGDLNYEHRLVAFFDILGWRNEIAAAGSDPKRIARLAAAVRMFNANASAVGDAGARLTTFSDNVVFSKPYAEGDVEWLLQSLAVTQLGLAVQGLWMRGGVTIGDIHHDDHIVFGPALNRAYELESKIADMPRIMIDANVPVPSGTDFIESGEATFLDPFKPKFWDRVQGSHPPQQDVIDKFNALSGITVPATPVIVSGGTALGSVAHRLSLELMDTGDPKTWAKLSWLFDRVVQALGGMATANDLTKSATLLAALAGAADPA